MLNKVTEFDCLAEGIMRPRPELFSLKHTGLKNLNSLIKLAPQRIKIVEH